VDAAFIGGIPPVTAAVHPCWSIRTDWLMDIKRAVQSAFLRRGPVYGEAACNRSSGPDHGMSWS
jgi:hypothetical protein